MRPCSCRALSRGFPPRMARNVARQHGGGRTATQLQQRQGEKPSLANCYVYENGNLGHIGRLLQGHQRRGVVFTGCPNACRHQGWHGRTRCA
jgi:hypothetical protein